MKINRPLLFRIFVFIALPALIYSCTAKKEKIKNTEEKKMLSLVKIEKANIKLFEHKIISQGNIKCKQEALLNAEIGGLVTGVHVKEGDYVNSGQPLVSLDTELMSLNLNELETQLEYANFLLGKQNELKNKGLGTEMELEAANNQVAALNAKKRILNAQIKKSNIVSPFSGIINTIYAEKGEVLGPQNPVIQLINNSTMELVSSISEKHLNKVKIGSEIEVTFPNYIDTTLHLKIEQISKKIDATNRTFEIKSEMKQNKLFLSNMLAEVKITDLSVNNGLIIPSKSIMKSPQNIDFIFVAKKINQNKFSVKEVSVQVIEKYNGEALIKNNSEINETSLIITEGGRGITSKDFVRIN